uniref:Uncharacterized protein n=1 Tax=Lactuca sativa TaxID=4236 RepID=A0A9R1UQX1_LACSA|nr:hypothetical protein LSAT_V11C800441990 [Lactuca sativa]
MYAVTDSDETEVEEAINFSMFSSTHSLCPAPVGCLPPADALPSVFTTFVLLKIDSTIDRCSTSCILDCLKSTYGHIPSLKSNDDALLEYLMDGSLWTNQAIRREHLNIPTTNGRKHGKLRV